MIAVVVDTNIYFSAFYSLIGNEAEIIKKGNREELLLLSPDIVKEELERNFKLELGLDDVEVLSIISSLPTVWVPRIEYEKFLEKTKSALLHEEDAPILACAMRFGAGVLTGNVKHFRGAKSKVPVWSSSALIDFLAEKAKRETS